MANIEDRVVAMSFENTKFQTGVSSTLDSLQKLNESLKRVGTDNGLDGIEKSANKINFLGLGTAIDKLKARLGFGREASTGFGEIENASNKVTLTGASSAIDKLKAKLGFGGEADRSFASIERSAGRVTLSGLGSALDGITTKFGALQVAGVAALGTLVNKATTAGLNIVKSLTIAPVTTGLQEYETQLNSVQTILANTSASGAKLKDVNKALLELNHYADKTIYNFSEMTRNIGTFTAAGVDLKTATASIKGIANLAALSGSNSQQASTAMYQLSQAISSGRVGLQDWNSVVNAGMGGSVFQRALANTAEKMGTLSKGSVELKGKMKNVTVEGQSFRESIMAKPGEQSWLTSKVLTQTLKQFTGDMSDADLAAQGFSKTQIKAIQAQAKTALDAATKVKTLSGVIDTAKEAAGSGWAQTWQLIFGNFGEARTLFTGVSNAVNGFISASANARNKVLGDWKELGGRKALIEGIKNVFEALKAVIKPLKDAFREIFPAKTGKDLFDLTTKFEKFTETLKIGPDTADKLKRTFAGLFAVLDIGKQIVGGIFRVIGHLFGAVGEGSGGFLNLTGSIGDFLVSVDEALKKGGRLNHFFDVLGAILATPIRLLGALKDALGNVFSGASGNVGGGIAGAFTKMTSALKPSQAVVETAKTAWTGLVTTIQKVASALKPAIDAIVNAFKDIGGAIVDALKTNNFDDVFKIIQTTLIGGIFLALKKALGKGLTIDFGQDAIKGLSKNLDTLNGSLGAIQSNIKANTLLQISAAVALLAVSVVALSRVNPDRLASSMTAIAVGLGQLMGAMALVTKIGGKAGFVKLPVIAAGLILLAVAVDILVIAIAGLSRLSWEELARGLGGVTGALVALSVATVPLTANAPGMVRAGIGLIAIGGGLLVVSAAVKIFATMKWEEMGRGLAGVAGALVAIGLAVNLIPASIFIVGPGMIAMGIALVVLAGAVKLFGAMSLETLAKGIGAIAASLVVIGLAVGLIPPTLPITAAGLILVGIALTSIAGAIALLGHMNFGTLAKGIGAIAASLAVLAIGLTAMVAALPGAAALLVASAALAIFAPVLGLLGNLSWGTIIKGLVAIAASLVVIGVTGLIAAPALILLGAGLVALGVGVLAVGTGVSLLAKGLVILGSDGSKGVAIVIAAITGLVAILPKVIIDFLSGLVKIVAQIAKIAPMVVDSVVKIINSMLNVVIQSAPKFAEATTAIIMAMLKILAQNAGPIIDAGWTLLKQLLSGIANNIGHVTSTVATIVVRFLTALSDRLPRIVEAGATLLVRFLKGVADNLDRVITAAGTVVVSYIRGVSNNIDRVVTAGANMIIKFVSGIANSFDRVFNAGLNILNKLISGLIRDAEDMAVRGAALAGRFINAVAKAALTLVDEGARAVLHFIRGVTAAIKQYDDQFIDAGYDLAEALIAGMVKGLLELGPRVVEAAKGVADGAVKKVKGLLKIFSPSRVFADIGRYMMLGWVNGIDQHGPRVNDSVVNVIDTMQNSLRSVPGILDGLVDLDPTITPVLDLTQVQSEAKKLSDLTNVTPITAATSYVQAASISVAQLATPDVTADSKPIDEAAVIKFEQNNYSPESLSEAEIYRQTNNQLARAKVVLGLR